MTEFYSNGTLAAENGSKTFTSEGAAVWIPANVKRGDMFIVAGSTPNVITADPVYDEDNDVYTFEAGLEYGGSTDTGLSYIIIKTSSDWGTNRTLSVETAELIQAFSVGLITETELNAAVAAAEAAQEAAEDALAAYRLRVLEPKTADPATDDDGGPLAAGMVYLNTATGFLRIYSGTTWSNMLAGQQGVQGVDAGVNQQFMSPTSDADPGGGNFRLNNGTHASATKMWIDNLDLSAVDISALIDSWDDSTSATRGFLTIRSRANPGVFRLYKITGSVVDKTGYREVTLVYVTGAGTLNNATPCALVFVSTGEKGDTGAAGQTAGVQFAFSTTTADADPGAGALRANHATFSSITQLFIDNADNLAVSATAWLDSLDDVANGNTRGYLRLQKTTDPSVFMEFAVVGAVVDGGGYRKVPVSPISGAVPANATVLALTFAPAGADAPPAVDGSDPGVLYNFDDATADSNPTAGFFKANHATFSSATQLFVSKTDRGSLDVSGWLATLDDSSNTTGKGQIILARPSDGARALFKLTGLTDASGYVKLAVTYLAGVAFADNDPISFQFNATGDRGASGAGSGDVEGPSSAVDEAIALFDGTTGKLIKDSGATLGDLARNDDNLSGLDDKLEAIDNLSLKGANVASAATVNLDAVTGQLIHITGTVSTANITLASGKYRRLVADAAWPVTTGGNIVLNNGGSGYTFSAGDQIDAYGDGATVRLTIIPASGTTPGSMPYDADLVTWAGLSPSANFQTLVSHTFAQIRADLDLEAGTDFYSMAAAAAAFEAKDADLTALAGNSTNGLWARTGAGSGAARTITAGAGMSVTNGDGVSGNPTIAADIGKETIWIPAAAWKKRSTNGPSKGSLETTTNKNIVDYWAFDPTTQEFISFQLYMPKSWDEGTITFRPVWTHPATTTNFGVVWGLDAVAKSDDDPHDAAYGTEQTSTDTGGTTSDNYIGPESSAITIAGTPTEGDVVDLRLHRNPSAGSDTMAVDAYFLGAHVYFTRNALKDN